MPTKMENSKANIVIKHSLSKEMSEDMKINCVKVNQPIKLRKLTCKNCCQTFSSRRNVRRNDERKNKRGY